MRTHPRAMKTPLPRFDFCRTRLQAVEDPVKVVDNGPLKPWHPNP